MLTHFMDYGYVWVVDSLFISFIKDVGVLCDLEEDWGSCLGLETNEGWTDPRLVPWTLWVFLGFQVWFMEWSWFRNIASPTLLNIMWQPGWEGSLGENGYMFMRGWVHLLSTCHSIVNQLHLNIKVKKEKRNIASLESRLHWALRSRSEHNRSLGPVFKGLPSNNTARLLVLCNR